MTDRTGRPRAHASIEAAYHAQTVPTTDGHMRWTGPTNSTSQTPLVFHAGQRTTVYKIAFRLEHNREPEGQIRPACGMADCVAGAHLHDATLRQASKPQRRQFNPPPASRTDIIALLAEGRTDRYIVQALRTSQKRVSRIRAEYQLPRAKRRALPLEQVWTARTKPTPDGHLAWTGALREGVPVVKYDGEEYTARRLAFQMAHGREPQGRVKAGCGWGPCVKPEHVEDQQMRNQFNQIFGA